MKKSLLILAFALMQILTFAQQKALQLTGTILDSATTEAITNVSLKVNGTIITAQSNAIGNYSIRIPAVPAVVCFTHLNYETFNLNVDSSTPSSFTIKLKKKVTVLPIFDVTTNKPQTLAREQPLYIKDYGFYNDKIIVLAYKDKMFSKALLCLMNMDGDTLCSVHIKDPDELYRDCFGNNHLVTKSTDWQLFIDSNIVNFIYPSDIEKFNELLKPVLAEKDNKLIYQQYYYNNQLLQYFFIDKSTRKAEELKVIADEKKMFMLRDAARIIEGSDDPETQARFENLAFYKPIYAPLVKINDTICIFNFPDSVIEFYSDSCKLAKEVPISFSQTGNWKRKIFVDDAKGKVYAMFRKNGITTLKEISLKNGELLNTVVIPEFPFIDNIKVYNNNVYFLYTEHNEINEFKRLYRMKI